MRHYLAVILLALGIAACVCSGSDIPSATDDPELPNDGATTDGGSASPTDEPTEIVAAGTPSPTNTPSPSNTPEPTATATTPPEPIEVSGTGQTVTETISVPFSISRIVLTHQGSSNFIVHAFSSDDEAYLVNEIGAFSGSVLLEGAGDYFFEIDADGAWTMRIESPGINEDIATNGLSGRGATVSDFFTPTTLGPVPYHFTHNGEANFIVHLICGDETDFIQNEIGVIDADAVARFEEGSCLWVVEADGDWTIAPK